MQIYSFNKSIIQLINNHVAYKSVNDIYCR